MTTLDEISSILQATAALAGPATVGIGSGWGQGSGVVVKPGLVLTNAHNLRDAPATLTFADGRIAEAEPRGVDIDADLAVLASDTAEVSPIAWSDTSPSLGSPVIALANPGGRGLRVTHGHVSALSQRFRGPRGRRIAGSIEHTAPLAKGSSGGPLLDTSGRLLGVNTNRLGEGFYLAIPADEVLRAKIEALAAGQVPPRRHLGAALAPAQVAARLRAAVGLPEREGLLVRGVEPAGPAAQAGLAVGDLIVSAGGRPVSKVDDLHSALDAGDEPLILGVLRGAEEQTLTVAFGK
ncbi:MAG: S1C family serine protease [Candidatus Dormibacteria bacterium]